MGTARHLATAATIISLGLAGCTSTPNPDADTGLPPPVDCGAAALQGKSGQPVSGQTAASLRIGGEPVQSRGLVRVVAPGQAVTMDFNPNRLTIETDTRGNLVRAICT